MALSGASRRKQIPSIQLTSAGLVRKQKMGRTIFYINDSLYSLLSCVTL
jgi:hypothetical protein